MEIYEHMLEKAKKQATLLVKRITWSSWYIFVFIKKMENQPSQQQAFLHA